MPIIQSVALEAAQAISIRAREGAGPSGGAPPGRVLSHTSTFRLIRGGGERERERERGRERERERESQREERDGELT
jgi:hypothetical protein